MKNTGIEERSTAEASARHELIAKYRHVFFGSPMGHDVLADILQSARFLQFQTPGNTQDAAGQNFGITILQRCGILTEGTSMREIVEALAQILPEAHRNDLRK
jgi:hypothetical protein